MTAYVVPGQQPQIFQEVLARVLAGLQQRAADERAFANQRQLLDRQAEIEAPLRTAQIENYGATTEATRTGAQNQTAQRTFAENATGAEMFFKNTVAPLLRANQIGRVNQLKAAYGQRNPLVASLPDFDATDAYAATANSDKWAADLTAKVAGGDQNAIGVDLARKLSTGEALPGPQFANQEQREMGTKALSDAVAIKADRRAGATPMLQAATQTAMNAADIASAERIAAQGRASQERIAEMRADAQAPGMKPLSGEASKVLAIAQTVQPEIARLKAAFADDYRGTLAGIVTGTNREMVKLRDNIADKIGRLRSGGAINKDEEKRFIRQLGGVGDLAFGSADEATSALDGILTEAQSVERSILGGNAPAAGGAKTVTRSELQRMGATEDEARREGYTVVD